jgi:hypothetical protein
MPVRAAHGYHRIAITTVVLGKLDAEIIEYFIEDEAFHHRMSWFLPPPPPSPVSKLD